jgi:hypothetical protein
VGQAAPLWLATYFITVPSDALPEQDNWRSFERSSLALTGLRPLPDQAYSQFIGEDTQFLREVTVPFGSPPGLPARSRVWVALARDNYPERSLKIVDAGQWRAGYPQEARAPVGARDLRAVQIRGAV